MIKKKKQPGKIFKTIIWSFLFLLLVNGLWATGLNAQLDQDEQKALEAIDRAEQEAHEVIESASGRPDTPPTLNVRERLKLTGGEAGFGKTTDLSAIVGDIIKAFLGFLGVVALILIIYGGYMWMTAGGNEEKVGKAKTLLRNAVIGLIIISLAYAITAFVIQRIVGAAV